MLGVEFGELWPMSRVFSDSFSTIFGQCALMLCHQIGSRRPPPCPPPLSPPNTNTNTHPHPTQPNPTPPPPPPPPTPHPPKPPRHPMSTSTLGAVYR